jgi:glycosyltransferase involved in cell wall biosynthesis
VTTLHRPESDQHLTTPLLSVVMPAYNEQSTIREIVRRVLSQPVVVELIVVDDGSTDGTRGILRDLVACRTDQRLRLIFQPGNRGKGAALRRGIREALGEYVVIQDADLEYNPRDYQVLIRPCLEYDADVVYGSRFVSGAERRVLFFWHAVGNLMLTLLSNAVNDLNLTDMETGYKLFRRQVLQNIELEQDRFGFEPEVTAKIAHRGLRIYEVGISYAGRGYDEGKKIGWKDAFEAVYCIVRYGLEQRLWARTSTPKRYGHVRPSLNDPDRAPHAEVVLSPSRPMGRRAGAPGPEQSHCDRNRYRGRII